MDGVHVQKQVGEQQNTGDPLNDMRRYAAERTDVLSHSMRECAHAFLNLPGNSIALLRRPMLSVNEMPFGHTTVQLNCVWQRQTPARSLFNTAMRSVTAPSRGSINRRK